MLLHTFLKLIYWTHTIQQAMLHNFLYSIYNSDLLHNCYKKYRLFKTTTKPQKNQHPQLETETLLATSLHFLSIFHVVDVSLVIYIYRMHLPSTLLRTNGTDASLYDCIALNRQVCALGMCGYDWATGDAWWDTCLVLSVLQHETWRCQTPRHGCCGNAQRWSTPSAHPITANHHSRSLLLVVRSISFQPQRPFLKIFQICSTCIESFPYDWKNEANDTYALMFEWTDVFNLFCCLSSSHFH